MLIKKKRCNRLWTIKLLTMQSKFINLCFISKKLIHVTYKVQPRFGNLIFKQKIDSCEKKFYLRFKLFKKIFKAVPKNNSWTHSPQQSCVDNNCLFQSINSYKVAETIIVLRLTFLLKRVFPVRNRKSEHRHWILHIWIRLGTKFQLKLTVFIFWIKFAQKGFFPSKTEKVKATIEFCIFELV